CPCCNSELSGGDPHLACRASPSDCPLSSGTFLRAQSRWKQAGWVLVNTSPFGLVPCHSPTRVFSRSNPLAVFDCEPARPANIPTPMAPTALMQIALLNFLLRRELENLRVKVPSQSREASYAAALVQLRQLHRPKAR